MIRITAITIRVWIQPPVRGNLGLMRPPKKPSSHRTIRMTIIVPNIIFSLVKDLSKTTRSFDQVAKSDD
jgi:hypothetical protein